MPVDLSCYALYCPQEFWKYDPFEAVKDEKGDIYARGSQVIMDSFIFFKYGYFNP